MNSILPTSDLSSVTGLQVTHGLVFQFLPAPEWTAGTQPVMFIIKKK